MCLSRSLFLSLLLEAARHLQLVLEFCSDARTHAPTWSSTFGNNTTAGMTRVSQCRMYLADFDAGTGLQMSWLALQTVVSSKCCLIEVK